MKHFIFFLLKTLGIKKLILDFLDLRSNKRYFDKTLAALKTSEKNTTRRFEIPENENIPCYWDRSVTTPFDRHYIFHTSWAARVVQTINPELHVDISSSLFFSTIVSAFVPIDYYDYRPAKIDLSNFRSYQGDVTGLPFKNDSISSLSCLHTLEHIGLGRYGDEIDYDGDLKGFSELKRVVSLGGNLIIVVPVGQPKIAFNAHRIYSYEQIIAIMEGFTLLEFTLLTDDTNLHGPIENADPSLVAKQQYGCGCFWFKKG
jgi:hypothetical protein